MAKPASLPELGVCYYPEHWPESQWAEDATRMVELGLSWVRIGDWLDRAIDILGKAGLKIILGTPSATPPYWMSSKFPDMLAVTADGQARKFGSRRHYNFSHKAYREAAAHMARQMSKRYGTNPHIQAWQVDNEYGCHDTILSYDLSARENFQHWLKNKYKTITALNASWGNIFWSMEYPDFQAIDLPNQTVAEPNPSHLMDFRRFASDEVVAWNKVQVDAIRTYSDLPISHNYMGRILDFDHFDVGADLEIATWDSYPLGFLEDRSDQDDRFKHSYARQGDPDFQAFHHDLYRAVGRMKSNPSRWWVMEQQPGPVNWAPYNPAPLPGMVKLWSWEAIAHGAEVISYFRWRQAHFAQEQMHSGLLAPNSNDMPVIEEVKSLAKNLPLLEGAVSEPSNIAIVFDYASAWAWEIQPQGQDFDYFRLVYDLYTQLRKRGYSIDILPPTISDFGERDYVFIPGLMTWNKSLKQALNTFRGKVIIGPRSGSKTENFQIPETLPPNLDGMDTEITAIETLHPDCSVKILSGGTAKFWREFAQTSEDVVIQYEDGHPALIQKETQFYVTGWFDKKGYAALFNKLGLNLAELPPGVRCRDLGPFKFYMNYSTNRQKIRIGTKEAVLDPTDVLLVQKETHSLTKI